MAHVEQILPAETFGNSAKVEIPIPTTSMHFISLGNFVEEERLRSSLETGFIRSFFLKK